MKFNVFLWGTISFLPQNFEGTISSDIQWSGWCVDLNLRGAANHQHRGWRDHGDGRSSPSAWPESHRPSGGHHEKRGDLPVVSNHKFVLIDVELHPFRPSVQVDFVRAAYLVPEAFTRSNLLDFHGCCTMQDHRWSLFGLEEWPPYCPTRTRRFAMNWYPGPGDVCWLINPNYSYTVVL